MDEVLAAGHVVVGQAENGDDLVLKYKQINPDLTTIDISMDGCDGFDAIRAILEYDENARIIVVSALSDNMAMKTAEQLGVEQYIVKPFEPGSLAELLRKVI